MMWICPICWEVFGIHEKRCQRCGSDLVVTEGPSFEEKLQRALENPEPDVAARAADILGRRAASSSGIAMLERALKRRWHEPDLAAAIVRAISRLGGPRAHAILVDALGHESMIVRAAAAQCFQTRARIAS